MICIYFSLWGSEKTQMILAGGAHVSVPKKNNHPTPMYSYTHASLLKATWFVRNSLTSVISD